MTSPPHSDPEPASPSGQPYQQPGESQYQAGQAPYQPAQPRPEYQPGQPYQQPYQQQPYQQQPYQPYPQQYPGAAPPPPPSAVRKRGRTPLRLALIFGVIGVVLVIVGGIVIGTKSYSKVNGFSRVSIAAGSGTAQFSSAGNYLAYYEASDVTSNIKSVPLPLVALRSPSGKVQVLNTLYGGASRSSLQINSYLTYQFNGHNGVAIYQFTVPEAGRYDVRVQATGNEAPGADIAFGKSIGSGIAVGAALLVPGILLIVAAIVLLIVGLVQRSKGNKQAAAAPYGPPPGSGYPPAQQPGAGYPPPDQPSGWQKS